MIDPAARNLTICGSAILLALIAVHSANAQAEDARPKKAFLEYRPALKDGNNNPVDLIGPDAEECVKFDGQGLRIKLPAGHPGVRQETGMRFHVDIKGDFEITMSFDLLHEPGPQDAGFGTRTTLGVRFDGPETHRDATISRVRNAKGVTQFSGWATALADDAGNKAQRIKYAPTDAKTGRLRLVRAGTELSYCSSEGANGEFVLFNRCTMSAEDVKKLRVAGTTGGPKASLDVRITDLLIRAESLPGLPAELLTNGPGAPEPKTGAGNTWLIAIGVGGAFFVAVVLALGALLFLRQRRARKTPDEVEPSGSASALTFACSGCERQLTVQPELAGKKVKCAKCGTVVRVPQPIAP